MNDDQQKQSVTSSDPRGNSLDPEIVAALEEICTQIDQGKPIDRQTLLERYSEIADELVKCLDGLDLIQETAKQVDDSLNSSRTTKTIDDAVSGLLGDFRIIRELGRGGMGVVYEAEQISLKRTVAIKLLPFAAILDDRQLKRFKNEAQAAASLEHPNIVNVFYVGTERGIHFYAMRYIDGQSVADLIRRLIPDNQDPNLSRTFVGRQPEPNPSISDTQPVAELSTQHDRNPSSYYRSVSRMVIQAADALHYSHQLGVIHRDIKPSNLLLDGEGRLWITDFGLASTQTGDNITMTGDILGTLRYMSPEQAKGDVAIDHRTDVYSLGIVLYELLTGRCPFTEGNRHKLLRDVIDTNPVPPRKRERNLPLDLETITLKAIAKSPSDRYTSAADFANDLRNFLDHKPIRARRVSRAGQTWRWARRNPSLAALVLLLICLVVIAPIIAIQQRQLAERARLENYQHTMNAAYQAWHRGAFRRVDALLAAHIPRSGQRDLRGFEWYHLKGRIDSAQAATMTMSHPDEVSCFTFSPDGKQLWVGCRNGLIRIWDFENRTILKQKSAHNGPTLKIVFQDSGHRVASYGRDRIVRLWDVNRFEEISSLDLRLEADTKIAFSNDGRLLAIALGLSREIQLWDLHDASAPVLNKTIESHGAAFLSDIAFSPNGRHLASSSWDRTIRIRNISDGEELAVLDEISILDAVAFSSDGKLLAAAGDGFITLWYTQNWKRAGRLQADDCFPTNLVFSNNCRCIIARAFGRITVWDTQTQDQVMRMRGPASRTRFAVSPDDRWVATTNKSDVYLTPLNLKTSPTTKHDRRSRDTCIAHFVTTTHGPKLLVGRGFASGYGVFHIYDGVTLDRDYSIDDLPKIFAIATCPTNPNLVAIGGGSQTDIQWNGAIHLMDLHSGEQYKRLVASPGQTLSLAFSPDGTQLAVSHYAFSQEDDPDPTIDLWDMETFQLLYTIDGSALSLHFTEDGKEMIAVGGRRSPIESGIRYYDVQTGIMSFATEGDPLFLKGKKKPGTGLLLTVDMSRWLNLWDVHAREKLWTSQSQSDTLMWGMAFSPDGTLFAGGGINGQVKLWSSRTGAEVGSLNIDGTVGALCFSDSGDRLFATSRQGRLTVWHKDGRKDTFSVPGIEKKGGH